MPLNLVGDDVTRDEEGDFVDAAHWRQAHTGFQADTLDLVRADAGDPEWLLRETEPVVVQWLRLLEQAAPPVERTTSG